MIGFSNLDNLINLCGARMRFGESAFARSEGGAAPYCAKDLARAVKAAKISGDASAEIKSLMDDSRRVTPGAAFFAVKGANTDGNRYVEEAAHRGAKVVVSEQPAPKIFPATWIQCENMAEALARAAKNFYNSPDEAMKIFAATGTNGKTSVTWMLQKILSDNSLKCGLIGTIHYDLGGRCLPAGRTTPQALELYAMLNQMRYADCRAAAVEISSHAVAQGRARGMRTECAAFLNLTQDHLDYHGNMDDYFETKASLFTGALGSLPKSAVLNFDDPRGREIAGRIKGKCRVISFGIESRDADIRAEKIDMLPGGSKFTAVWDSGEEEARINMPGEYNVLNALAAAAMARAADVEIPAAMESLRTFKGVPGRMQKAKSPPNFDIFVDYAHTDDALKNGLSMLRKVAKGKLLVVFGCGGKRDRAKRPLMVRAVQKYADIAWATSDNPRGEDLGQIFSDMKKGVEFPDRIAFVEDRRRAINLAIDAASDGDCILIAGKGHETFQELGDTIIPFDDKRVAEELLNLKGLI